MAASHLHFYYISCLGQTWPQKAELWSGSLSINLTALSHSTHLNMRVPKSVLTGGVGALKCRMEPFWPQKNDVGVP